MPKKRDSALGDLATALSVDPLANEPIIESICSNIKVTERLSFLQLCSIRLSLSTWRTLASSLVENETIEILVLNAMAINP